jgi:hypothetical protein
MMMVIMIASMGQSGNSEHPNADVVHGRGIAKFLLLFVIFSIFYIAVVAVVVVCNNSYLGIDHIICICTKCFSNQYILSIQTLSSKRMKIATDFAKHVYSGLVVVLIAFPPLLLY